MVGTVDKWHQEDEKAAVSTEAVVCSFHCLSRPLSVRSLKFFVYLFSSLYLKLTPEVQEL